VPGRSCCRSRPPTWTSSRTIFGEARGETLQGQVAVAWTVLNRALIDLGGDGKPDWWGEGILQVCRKPGQYSCWSGAAWNAANRRAMERAQVGDPDFLRCLAVAHMTIAVAIGAIGDPDFDDPTTGSTHYFAPASVGEPPAWAWVRTPDGRTPRRPACSIGRHVFFNDVEK
jgi:N-acetylmuramoyl-L-alanine amidase